MKKIPNFLIVGAGKCGTTSLYYYLKQHPDVYMCPIKEPNYFSKDINPNKFRKDFAEDVLINIKRYIQNGMKKEIPVAFIRNEKDYLSLFKNVKNERMIGEASTSYLYSKVAAKEIFKFNPNMKIIIILRDPVERACSHYLMDLRMGYTSDSFFDAIKKDYYNKNKGWGISNLYIELGEYYQQVKRYIEVFPKENIKILSFNSLRDNPKNLFIQLFKFLKIKYIETNFNEKKNISRVPKNNFSKIIINNKLVRKYWKLLPTDLIIICNKIFYSEKGKPNITSKEMVFLQKHFERSSKKLKNLIGKKIIS